MLTRGGWSLGTAAGLSRTASVVLAGVACLLLLAGTAGADIIPADGDVIPAHEVHGKHLGQLSGLVAGPFGGQCHAAAPEPPLTDAPSDYQGGGRIYYFTYTGDAEYTEYEDFLGGGTEANVQPGGFPPHNCRAGVFDGDGNWLNQIYEGPGPQTATFTHYRNVYDCCSYYPKSSYQTATEQAETYIDTELVHFTVVAPPPKKRFTDDEKAFFAKQAALDGGVTAALGGVAVGCALTGVGLPCTLVTGAAATVTGISSAVFGFLAADPVISGYRHVPVAHIVYPAAVHAGSGVSAGLASSLTALQRNAAQQIADGDALKDAIGRSQGAAQAHQARFERLQLRAAARFARGLAAALRSAAGLRARVVQAMGASAVPDVPVTADDLAAAQHEIYLKTPPAQITSGLSAFAVSGAQRRNILSRIEVAPPAAGVSSLDQLLGSHAWSADEAGSARALLKFARSVH